MRRKKIAALVVACSVLCSSLLGCAQPQNETIIVGGVLSLSGPVSVYGSSISNGIQLATQQVNQAGGLLGKQIEYIEEDDKGEGKEAKKVYKELKKQKVAGIIGAVTTEASLVLAQVSRKDGIAIISPSATAAEITSYGDNMFSVCYTDPYQSRTMASFASETMAAKRMAIFYEFSDAYSSGSAHEFGERATQLGAQEVIYYTFSKDDSDYTRQLSKIKKDNPEVIFIPTQYKSFRQIAVQAKQLGIDAVLLGNDGCEMVFSDASQEEIGALEGVYFCAGYYAQHDDEKSRLFAAAYEQQYGRRPDSFAALGYDAAMLLYGAIEAVGKPNSEKVIQQITCSETEGVTGPIYFNCLGDPENKRIFIFKIEQGQPVLQSLIAPEPV